MVLRQFNGLALSCGSRLLSQHSLQRTARPFAKTTPMTNEHELLAAEEMFTFAVRRNPWRYRLAAGRTRV